MRHSQRITVWLGKKHLFAELSIAEKFQTATEVALYGLVHDLGSEI
jgi:hypothetical protein